MNKKYCSSPKQITNAGVPGPFLFFVCFNDITVYFEKQIWVFADDTSLFVNVDSNTIGAVISLTNNLEKFKNGLHNGWWKLTLIKL